MSVRGTTSLRILDPGLFFEGGHHASFARTISAAADESGIRCEIQGLRRIDHPPDRLSIGRCFRRSAYEVLRTDEPYEELASINDDMLDDLVALGGESSSRTVTLFPTVTSRLVLAAARWASSDRGGTSAMLLMFPPGFAGGLDLADAERRLYREAIGIINGLPPGRVRLFAETARIAQVFEELGAQRIEPLAWPVTVSPVALDRGERGPHARVAHLGYTKVERGFALLPSCVRRVQAASPDVRFTIQANYWNPEGVAEADAVLSRMDGVAMLRGPMPPDAYAREMESADIVLLPYQADAYRHRGSGVFVEAAALGRGLVIPAGTWMADQAREHELGAVMFDRFDAESVSDAVLRAVEHRSGLLERAARAVPGWVGARAPSRFLSTVMGVRGSDRTGAVEAA